MSAARRGRRCGGAGRIRGFVCAAAALAWLALGAHGASARERVAGPADYLAVVPTLAAGDTLSLVAGEYRGGLTIHHLHGKAGRPIVIRGPAAGSGGRAIFVGRDGANTVSLADASHVAISDLWLDGRHAEADAVKAEGSGEPVHHVTLERLTIVAHDRAQDVVGISTKCPAWDWTIRDNVIVGAGTGMYLGNSDGRAPFVAGTIENNVVIDSIGYDIEIKHQLPRPALAGMPRGASVTTLRGNVFTKSRHASGGELARPNVLLGAFPTVGEGRDDRYEFVGNTLFDNPSEALFQGEGNLSLAGNVFVNGRGDAVVVQPHHDRPRRVTIADNFVAATGRGIVVTGADPRARQSVVRNLVYAGTPLAGIADPGNRVAAYREPATTLGRWLARHWMPRDLAERTAVLGRACAGEAAGADVCSLLGAMRAARSPGAKRRAGH